MNNSHKKIFNDPIIIAGHICVDIIVELESSTSIDSLLVPGKLHEIGPAALSGGGAVFNTGVALHKLGADVKLIGKIGNDLFGRSIEHVLNEESQSLSQYLLVNSSSSSSYTLVLSSPGFDRVFLHHPGANDSFSSDDVYENSIAGPGIFHFGYPPLMKRFHSDGGKDMANLFQKALNRGLITSLDMAKPDPKSEAGQKDWKKWLNNVLPYVDLFFPSIDEILYMLNRPLHDAIVKKVGEEKLLEEIDGTVLDNLSSELISMGVAVVAIKLGEEGMYLRTSNDAHRVSQLKLDKEYAEQWLNLELLKPCFQTEVVGTTGSGDCSIAGFLSAFSRRETPINTVTNGTAVGAFSVEEAASTTAVPDQETVSRRVSSNWKIRKTDLQLTGWNWKDDEKIWIGPNHRTARKERESEDHRLNT